MWTASTTPRCCRPAERLSGPVVRERGHPSTLSGDTRRGRSLTVQSSPVSIPVGEAQVRATLERGHELFDLRYYGSEDMVVPAWWLGVFDPSGGLRRTAVSPRPDLSPTELTLWLRPLVGRDVAEELVRLVTEAVATTRSERRTATNSR